MKILVDDKGRVWTRDKTPEERYIDEAMAKTDWRRGLTISTQVVPDDTRFRQRPDGAYDLLPAREQPEGWADRKAAAERRERAWQDAQREVESLSDLPGIEQRLARIEDYLGFVPINRPPRTRSTDTTDTERTE